MSTTSAEAIETPKWPLLPRANTVLARVNHETELAVGENLHILNDDIDQIPHLGGWYVRDGITYSYPEDNGIYVSVDPVVIDLVREEREKNNSESKYAKEWHKKDVRGTIGRAAVILTEFFGSASGGGIFANHLPFIQPLTTIGGVVLGVVAGVVEIIGSVELFNHVSDNFDTKERARYAQKRAIVQESSLTFRIPKSTRMVGLPTKVKKVLENDENPKQLFVNTLMPNISAMVAYESQLAIIDTQLTQMEERSKVLGTKLVVEEDSFAKLINDRNEITAKANACLDPVNNRIIELDNIVKANVSAARFEAQYKLFMVEELEINIDNELREFYTSIRLAIKAAFIPCVNETQAMLAIEDISGLIKTISNPNLLAPIYEAFRAKYKASLNLPDYENLQNLIAKNREPS